MYIEGMQAETNSDSGEETPQKRGIDEELPQASGDVTSLPGVKVV